MRALWLTPPNQERRTVERLGQAAQAARSKADADELAAREATSIAARESQEAELAKEAANHEADKARLALEASNKQRVLTLAAHNALASKSRETLEAVEEAKRRQQSAVRARMEADEKLEAIRQKHEDVRNLADEKRIRDLKGSVPDLDTLPIIRREELDAAYAWVQAAEALLARLPEHRRSLSRLLAAEPGSAEHATQPKSADEQWRIDVLSGICRELESLGGVDGAYAMLKEHVAAWHDANQRARRPEIDQELWAATQRRIKLNARYNGLVLKRQNGLVPLGPDPKSRLEEFAHLGSGTIPGRRPDGTLSNRDDAGIVLVLIPSGSFYMGAQRNDPQGRNFDPQAGTDECGPNGNPIHVKLTHPFFISKYEITQAQWITMTGGSNPSRFKQGTTAYTKQVTWRNPVETITWNDCVKPPSGVLIRHGLDLPTESQWEYACRAGTTSAWWTEKSLNGADAFDESILQGTANIPDSFLQANGGESHWVYSATIDDDHGAHAPVGIYRANGFGLHDVHGNVWEWCRDAYVLYPSGPVKDPLGEGASSANRVFRGGSWYDPAADARSANRAHNAPVSSGDIVGARPARPVTP